MAQRVLYLYRSQPGGPVGTSRPAGYSESGNCCAPWKTSEDLDVIGRYAVDDAIRSDDQFARIWIVVLRHDAPDARVVDQVFGTPRELIKGAAGVERRVLGNIW
jgi:hypothetical protein